MRKLQYHEYRLLRKADFLKWKRESNLREVKTARRYHLGNPREYHGYNKIVGEMKQLCSKIKELPPEDQVRIDATDKLLDKLYDMGIIPIKNGLNSCDNINVSSICRRRLPVVMMRLKLAQNLKEATTLIEQGHIRIGPKVVKDPALLVTRNMEDFVTWVDTSKIKRKVAKFNDKLDDYDLLNA